MRRSHRFPSALVPLTLVALLAACSSDGGDASPSTSGAGAETTAATVAETTAPSTTAEPTTTTVDPAAAAQAYTEAGEHKVGVTTLQLAKGPKVEIWYPAADDTVVGTETYDVRDFTPDAVKALLTGDVPSTFSYDATRDADVADGTFPVVLFSHGFSGFRLQSTFLTAHLASHGMIVVSPDHPSRALPDVLGGTSTGDRADSVDDLLQSLDLITAAGTDPTSIFDGHVDTERVAAVGHSAGGGTILGAAADERVDGYVSMASGVLLGRAADGSTTTTVDPASLPAKPSFFLAGSVDNIVPVATVTEPSFRTVPSPSLLWVIDGVGHNGFDDFCTFGNGQGIIGVAEANGLGAFLDAQPQLKSLGQDGCIAPALPVDTTFPIIRHAVTAWLLAHFGVDAEPVGLDESVADQYSTPVRIEAR
ncbi:MAG: alpha/beta hydrolase family protein [Ilumatobacteraceae bacterium]